jgi:hypothetical protein
MEEVQSIKEVKGAGYWRIPAWRTVAFCLLSLGTWYFCVTASETVAGESSGVVMELPERVLEFYGRSEEASEAEKEILPDDTEFEKMLYFAKAPFTESVDIVACTIVLSGKDRRSIHRPQVCLAAQGWTFDSTEVIPLDLSNGKDLRVTKMALSRKEKLASGQTITRRALYLYWFVGKDVTIPDSKTRVILTAWDNVFRNVNHRWAYVTVMSPITEGLRFDGKDERETEDMLEEFISETVPQFQRTF